MLIDETMDSGRIEQAIVVFRLIDRDGKINEDFFGFVEAETATRCGLVDLLTKIIEEAGLSLSSNAEARVMMVRLQCMAMQLNGCQAHIFKYSQTCLIEAT